MKKCVVGLALLSIVVLSGCSNKESSTSKGTADVIESATSSSLTVESTDVSFDQLDEKVETSNPVVKRAEYTTSFSEDWKGLKESIGKVVVAELTDDEAEEQMLDNNYIVQVYFKIENNSDLDFDTYTDQSTLVIEGQQIEAEMFRSDDIGGEIMSGVTKEGVVSFSVPEISDVDNVNEIRLKWSASYESDNMDEESVKEFDVSFGLTK